MSIPNLEVRRLTGALGAEVRNVDLTNLSDEGFAALYDLWLEHQVLVIRDQKLTPESQLAFARRFGDIHLHPYMKGMDDYPELLEIIKQPGETYTFGAAWHSDQMFTPQPAKATMLYALETPSAGGDTIFASGYKAYDALSPGMKELIGRIRAVNMGRAEAGSDSRKERYAGNPAMAAKVKDPGNTPVVGVHPLARTHPETGRKALYIGGHSRHLEGMTEEESKPLLGYLRGFSILPEFQARVRWEPGTLTIWDNRCTQHYAVPDYDERRHMHRVTVCGDTPF